MTDEIPWRWRCLVVAPTNEPILWTEANSKSEAIRELLGESKIPWPYAQMNGYRLQWMKIEADSWHGTGRVTSSF